MCTVTFIPTPDGFYLTSNRDENKRRGPAEPPGLYSEAGGKLIFPRDADAGGSWVVLKEKATAAVLLNGAFHRHVRKPPYRQSRGVVLLEVMRQADPLEYLAGMDLDDVEPFTLVLFHRGNLWDCRWDGCRKHLRSMDGSAPHIWSSATLYDQVVAGEREQWFEEWLGTRERIVPSDVVAFHRTAGGEDLRNSLVMNRDNELLTVSVTSVVVRKDAASMVYHDLRTGEGTIVGFGRRWRPFLWFVKKLRARLTHWEFWPSQLIYGPLYPYWLWLSCRAQSLFFFSAANPRIENAGFTQERKSEIYRQLPAGYYPRTHLCPAGIDADEVRQQLVIMAMHFPLIAKPDIGERGTQVALLQSEKQLAEYCRQSKVDFLVQEYVSHRLEAGIFYVRLPEEEKGRITGIVEKEFLTITGDGHSTVRELLMRDPRSLLQLETLAVRYGRLLDVVLAEGVRQTLVPYGNHCRGAKFVDRQDRITPALTEAIDRICKKIPEFYFGRLDIKFASWEDLSQERNFSIIEVNGAGSEPTHIYDPRHSLFFAWKEIIRHWRLLFRISRANAKRLNLPLMGTRDGLRLIQAHLRQRKMLKQL